MDCQYAGRTRYYLMVQWETVTDGRVSEMFIAKDSFADEQLC
jgi:hypothetical protein